MIAQMITGEGVLVMSLFIIVALAMILLSIVISYAILSAAFAAVMWLGVWLYKKFLAKTKD